MLGPLGSGQEPDMALLLGIDSSPQTPKVARSRQVVRDDPTAVRQTVQRLRSLLCEKYAESVAVGGGEDCAVQ